MTVLKLHWTSVSRMIVGSASHSAPLCILSRQIIQLDFFIAGHQTSTPYSSTDYRRVNPAEYFGGKPHFFYIMRLLHVYGATFELLMHLPIFSGNKSSLSRITPRNLELSLSLTQTHLPRWANFEYLVPPGEENQLRVSWDNTQATREAHFVIFFNSRLHQIAERLGNIPPDHYRLVVSARDQPAY